MSKFRIKDGRSSFFQWDLNQQLEVHCSAQQVHFCDGGERSLVVEVHDGVANVPNLLLQKAGKLQVYAYVVGSSEEYTLCNALFAVLPRSRPDNYVYTETEVMTWETVSKASLDLLRNMDITAESGDETGASLSVIDDHMTMHLVIPKGEQGERGEQGIQGVQGVPGEKGEQGEPGAAAYVYFTCENGRLTANVPVENTGITFEINENGHLGVTYD